MSSNYTPLQANDPADAATFNVVFEAISNAIGDRDTLPQSARSSLVAALTETHNRVNAVHNADGSLKTGIVTNDAIAPDARVGSLAQLYDPAASVVAAVNKLASEISSLWNFVDPYNSRPISPIVPTLGGELLTNGTLEGAFVGGLASGLAKSSSTVAESADAKSGLKAQQWTATAQNGSLYIEFVPTTGKWYRLGVWAKRTGGTSGTARLSFRATGNIGWGGMITANAYTEYAGAIRAFDTAGIRAYLQESGTSGFDTLVLDDYSVKEISLPSCLAGARYTPSGDCVLKTRVAVTDGFQIGFAANLDSMATPLNGVFVYVGHWIYNPTIFVEQVVNGVWTNKLRISQTWNDNDLLELRKSGTLYSVYRNGALLGSTTITSPAIISNTLHTQFSTGGGSTTSLWTADPGTADLFTVYMGGSITQGSHTTTEAQRYVNVTDAWIKANLTQYTYRGAGFYNAGVGGTSSWYGLIRLQTDVIDKNPTVLSLDFAVNDWDEDVYRRSAEALIRRVRTALPDTRIVAIFYLSVANKDVDNPTNTHQYSYDAWKALCTHYGIPYADYAAGVTAAVQAGTLHLADYFWDTIHPNDAGHAYASTLLQPLMAAALAPGHMSPLPATRIYDNGDYEVTPIARNGTDNNGETGTGWSTVSTTARQSSTPDDTITWTGTFSSFGLHSNYSTGAGVLSWRVDGGAWTERDLSADIQTYRCLWSGTRGSHTVQIKVVSGTIRINRFLAV